MRLIYAVAAVFFVILIFFVGQRFGPIQEGNTGMVALGDQSIFIPALYAQILETGMCAGIDPQNCLIRLTSIDDTISHVNEFAHFKYSDLDDDGYLDFIFSGNGQVFCIDLKANVKWNFEVSKDSFDKEVMQSLATTAEYKRRDAQYFSEKPEYKKWLDLPENPTLDEAWSALIQDIQLLKICDFDGDNSKEVLLWLYGAVIVLDKDGNQKFMDIEGVRHKSIKILDGIVHDRPWDLYDFDNDGKIEFIVYRMSGYPMDESGKIICPYQYDGEISNARGLYVASYLGKKLFHLNLPYLCQRIEVCDWDHDKNPEIVIDTHSPTNGYTVNYSESSRMIVGNNLNWSTIPGDYINGTDDLSVGFLIMGFENGIGRVEFWKEPHPYETFGKNRPGLFFCSRYLNPGENGRLECIYHGNYDPSTWEMTDWFMQPWLPNQQNDFDKLDIVTGGYADLYHYQRAGLFGFETSKGFRRVFGFSPNGEVRLVDENYKMISSYEIDARQKTNTEWNGISKDAVIFDMKDLDKNGIPEILVGSGGFNSPIESERSKTSLIKILTFDPENENIVDFHPEANCDTFIADGIVRYARFETIDNDDTMDVLVISDTVYFLSPRWED